MLDGTAVRVERYMDLLSARQKLVARNIANVDTPGYRTADIDFNAEFQRVVKGSSAPEETQPQDLVIKNDGNNVSLDRESRLLAENAIRFNLASQLLRGQIRKLRTAINEGKSQ